MNPLGLYEPGTSVVHRIGVGWKIVALLLLAAATFAVVSPLWLAGMCGGVVVAYAVARVPLRRCGQAVRTIGPLVVVMFLLQWWLIGRDSAVVVCLRIFVALAAANLFTLTTRIDDIVTTIEHRLGPLCRFGVRPDRVGLMVGLTVQAVAGLSRVAGEVRDAQRARGASRSVVAFAVPFLVRTLRYADELGEALAARGVGDR
ncbi:energy-coupling factor transporter transmembrane component T family protein [Pseudonocardia sp. GCM10023141]|uniref:energy-coupling factor transporter transmembrane component T family protein n=1 Tax=Pseudonocardia sp. GCM10023141 TaxID=3252653 RepID=UPI003611BA51